MFLYIFLYFKVNSVLTKLRKTYLPTIFVLAIKKYFHRTFGHPTNDEVFIKHIFLKLNSMDFLSLIGVRTFFLFGTRKIIDAHVFVLLFYDSRKHFWLFHISRLNIFTNSIINCFNEFVEGGTYLFFFSVM